MNNPCELFFSIITNKIVTYNNICPTIRVDIVIVKNNNEFT